MLLTAFCPIVTVAQQQAQIKVKQYAVMPGWAKNSVNTVVFRKDPITTYKNTQYIAFYDAEANVVLGKRNLGAKKWETKITQYKGKATDAHNSISIMTDGKGFLHISWDHHGNALRYARSVKPGSLELQEKTPMTGSLEGNLTYPQFFKLPDGNLLFLYRDGSSGSGNVVLNYYNTATQQWTQRHRTLIDGNGQRNAYCQMDVDKKGTIQLSWVWRERAEVETNHDLCYARSRDGGITWEKTSGEKYVLPITAATAEYALKIPEKSELINQTSITADDQGNPYIATYWRQQGSKIPQYRVVYHNGEQWAMQQVSQRTMPFTLSGGGTKKIPISRPQIMVLNRKGQQMVVIVFRDEERNNKVSIALCKELQKGVWETHDLTQEPVGQWEPAFDTELWKSKGLLNLFLQKVEQADGEGIAQVKPEMISVLEWKP
ncbi:BNR repeat-containing protein [Pedobacter sp.]|uniref:BNR repeat-containing protein n=1 Tax=Pedobacter sp. TaxID=1411316 RepID=UPI003D7FBEEE